MMVFSTKIDKPIMIRKNKAAVRALDWSKTKRGILASGSGTADRRLRLWDINRKELINEIDT